MRTAVLVSAPLLASVTAHAQTPTDDAYCSAVTANTSVEQALQRAWVLDFGSQVIQTLQSRSLASKKG